MKLKRIRFHSVQSLFTHRRPLIVKTLSCSVFSTNHPRILPCKGEIPSFPAYNNVLGPMRR
jgi:hypothetical protein